MSKQSVLEQIEKECNNSRTFKFYDFVDEKGKRHILPPQEMIEHNSKFEK